MDIHDACMCIYIPTHICIHVYNMYIHVRVCVDIFGLSGFLRSIAVILLEHGCRGFKMIRAGLPSKVSFRKQAIIPGNCVDKVPVPT